ncbi:MAG: ABC transporter substrate-binding protein [Coriobacteriia bacterium]|nr:ABC transporter substrate-binding protein [Coriobacteriia bacterium]
MADTPTSNGARSSGQTDPAGAFRAPTRRQAIAGTGIVLGAAALASTPFLGDLFASFSRMLRPAVGVVAPSSARYPDLLVQITAGVRKGLAASGQADAPVFARTAPNSAPSSAAAAARSLIEREKVDVVLVYANPTRTGLLGDLAEETGVPVIVIDPGAHIVTTADADPRVLSHSLGHWQSAWALGSWAAGGLGKRAYVISSLYESGFDTLSAFEHGLQRSGGTVVGTSVTHVKAGDASVAAGAAAASGADAIFVAASGHEADEILSALAADERASKMPLLLPGLSVDRLVAAPGSTAHTALTWPVASRGAFEMLGEDVGALIAVAVEGGREALPAGSTSLAGARGRVEFDLATGRTDVSVRIHRASSSGGRVTMKPVADENTTAQASAFADTIVASPRTGWIDVYGSAM